MSLSEKKLFESVEFGDVRKGAVGAVGAVAAVREVAEGDVVSELGLELELALLEFVGNKIARS